MQHITLAAPLGKRKTGKTVFIVFLSLAVITAGILFSVFWLVPNINYNRGMELFENRQYEAAYNVFRNLKPDLKDRTFMMHESAVRSQFDVIKFGRFEWLVLEKQSDRMLVLSKELVDYLPFNELDDTSEGDDSNGDAAQRINWSNSSLRYYLNGQFYNSFSDSEKNRIFLSSLGTQLEVSYSWRDPLIVDTNDYVFLLSYDEFIEYFHHLSDVYYAPYYSGRVDITGWGTNTFRLDWWLRSRSSLGIGRDAEAADIIGMFQSSGKRVSDSAGVRPAMWISLSVLSEQ